METLKDQRGRTTVDTAKRLGLTVAILTAGGAATIAGLQTTHVIDVSSFLNSFNSGREIVPSEPTADDKREVFDNEAKKTKVDKKNILFISLEQATKLNFASVKIDKNAQKISFPLPFKLSKSTTGTIERIDLADTDPNAQDPTQRPPIALIDFKFDNIVAVVAPERSNIYLISGIQEWGQNPNLAGQVWFYKYYKEENTTVVWRFTDNNPIKLGSFNNLLPTQGFDGEILRGTNYESLPVVDALTEVMTTTEPNQPVRLSLMAYKGKIAGPPASIAGDDFLLKPQFFTDSPDGKGMLLALE